MSRATTTRRSVAALVVAGALVALLGTGPADGQAGGATAPAGPIPIQALPDGSGAESATPGGGGVWRASAGTGAEAVGTAAERIPEGTTSPNQERAGAESVIGDDGRVQITDTTSTPSSRIGQLNFVQGGLGYICSGWLIDPNTILMSGHCVHSGGTWGVPTTWMSFAPGRNGGTNPFGTCAVTHMFTTTQWLQDQDPDHDWGVGHLNCDVGDTVGWFGYRNLSTTQLLGRGVTVRGYPGDKPSGTMWSMADTVRSLSENELSVFYEADTIGGQSGSPVYEASGCGGPCGLAVHGYGCGSCVAPGPTGNSGPRLTAGRVDMIYATAAGNDDNPDALVRRQTGATFIGGDIVNLSGAGQSLTDGNVRRGATRKFVVRVQNDGATTDDIRVRGLAASPHFVARWFRGSTNVTAQVRAGTYTIQDLAPGASVDLRVEIKVRPTAPANAKVTATTIATAATSPNYSDRVKTTVRR